jgi:hypothetical protein
MLSRVAGGDFTEDSRVHGQLRGDHGKVWIILDGINRLHPIHTSLQFGTIGCTEDSPPAGRENLTAPKALGCQIEGSAGQNRRRIKKRTNCTERVIEKSQGTRSQLLCQSKCPEIADEQQYSRTTIRLHMKSKSA